MSASRQRVPYRVAGEAQRLAFARARAAKLSGSEWRVLSVVFDLTATYSRLEDETYAEAVAERAGIAGAHAVKRTRRILGKLARLGIIIWRPGRGAGRRSIIGLPPPSKKGAETRPPFPGAGRGKGGRNRPRKGGRN